MDNKTHIIERYENLRSSALDRQQRQDDHIRFIRKGMISWIVEEEIKTPIESKVNAALINTEEKNDFQPNHEPQIMQMIADILFKKIKGNKCYC